MNNRLANSLFRLSGYVTGIQPYSWLGKLEAMQWWESVQIRDWQCGELAKILHHAVSTVPYYQRVLPAIGPISTGCLEESLRRLPILTKEQVQDNVDQLQSKPSGSRRPLQIATSGSTGRPLKVRVDHAAFGRYFAAKLRALRWYDVSFADRQLRVWGFPLNWPEQVYWRLRDLFQNRIRLVSFDLSGETLDSLYGRCLSFQPSYINGYTSAIYRFACFIEQARKDGPSLGLRLAVPTSETLYEWQREQIERAFGCPVMNEYGCGEIQAIAYECPSRRLHITHENVIVEITDEDGNPVPAGEPGLLTLTSLCNKAMPLIRYQNGDMAVGRSGLRCKCGRQAGLPWLDRITGRSSDVLLRTDGETTHWTAIYYAIKDAFQPGMVLELRARQKALDQIELQIVRGPEYDDNVAARFLKQMRNILGHGVQLQLTFVDSIQREESGKLRYFASDIAEAQQRDRIIR